jgi:hypothetical protein
MLKRRGIKNTAVNSRVGGTHAEKQAQQYVYAGNDLRILTESLQTLAYLIHYLSKDRYSDSDLLIIELNYQCLGNVFHDKLSPQSKKMDQELWKRGLRKSVRTNKNDERGQQLFDRMDTSHKTDFLQLLENAASIAHSKAIWLEECHAVKTLILDRVSSAIAIQTPGNDADLKASIIKELELSLHVSDNDGFNLNRELFQSFQAPNPSDGLLGNIKNALNVPGPPHEEIRI